MSLLQWKPEFSVGIDSMDHEHREMIDLINGTYERLEANSDAIQIEACLGEILSTISMHFALEERLMKHSQYE
jgi:hemerythrin-like metal-binding protein